MIRMGLFSAAVPSPGHVALIALAIGSCARAAYVGTVRYAAVPLPTVPGGGELVIAFAISDAGHVTGQVNNAARRPEAFRWREGESLILLGDLPGGSYFSSGEGVNSSGHVAGESAVTTLPEAFLWTPTTGMFGLGDIPGGSVYASHAKDINEHDHVVGHSAGVNNRDTAFFWSLDTGMIPLGQPGDEVFPSVADAINNKTQVVGWGQGPHSNLEAFLWDPVNGAQVLEFPTPDYPNGYGAADAIDINELGQITGIEVFGRGYFWDPVKGPQPLGLLDGQVLYTQPLALNDHGQVVGEATDGIDHVAFVWDEANGIRPLETLIAAGTPPQARDLGWAYDINNAGQIVAIPNIGAVSVLLNPFIVGDGNCDGVVDLDDLLPVLTAVVSVEGYPDWFPDCRTGIWAVDCNQDAQVNFADLVALLDYLSRRP